MTQKEWSEKSEWEYKETAKALAKNVTIRTYINGNSSDNQRPSTSDEEEAIYGILMAAMLAYGRRGDADLHSILDTAEFAGHFLISKKEEVNCYDTIYIPLQRVMGEWR